MPAYNHERYVGEALASVAAQTHANIELIVINDGSTDGTRGRILAFLQDHPKLAARFVDQENRGVCQTLNRGLEMAGGDYVAFLASDDRWCPERLAVGLEFMEQNRSIGMVFSDAWMFRDGAGEPCLWSSYKSGLAHLFKNGVQNADMYAELLARPLVPALTVLVRRAVLDEVGHFDGALAYEDYDLWLRIAAKYPIAYLHRPLAYYRLHEANVSNSAALMLKGVMQTVRKHFRTGPYRHRRWRRWRTLARLTGHLLSDRLKKMAGRRGP
jgi:glycosyltransferase involved in cell wall biosynthesis